jgi:hypothetical protein
MQRKIFLFCGAIAGPIFTLSWFLQGLTRAGYDPMRHAISSLSVGAYGWMQIATFLVTGSFLLVFSFALRDMLQGPSGSIWGPRLIGLAGIGLIGAGIFVTDPFNGYPAGTALVVTERTTHGILHDLFGVPVFLGLPIAGIVFARFFARQAQQGWKWYSYLSGIGMFAVFFIARLEFRLLTAYPDITANFGILQRITLSIGFAWLTLLALHLLNNPAEVIRTEGK